MYKRGNIEKGRRKKDDKQKIRELKSDRLKERLKMNYTKKDREV